MPGGYNYVELSGIAPIEKRKSANAMATCSLPPAVASLVSLVFDEDKILNAMKESGIKIEELPLGTLNVKQIQDARAILVQLKDLVHEERARVEHSEFRMKNNIADPLQEVSEDARQEHRIWASKVNHLSTTFYQLIPSRDPKKLDAEDLISKQWDLLDMLENICTGQAMAANQEKDAKVVNELDEKFKTLCTDFRVVDRESEVPCHGQSSPDPEPDPNSNGRSSNSSIPILKIHTARRTLLTR